MSRFPHTAGILEGEARVPDVPAPDEVGEERGLPAEESAPTSRPLTIRQRFARLPPEKKVLAYLGAGAAGVLIGVLPYAGTLLGGNEYIEGEDGMLTPEAMVTAPFESDSSRERLDPATTDPGLFARQPYEVILSETVPILEQRRTDSLAKIDAYFASLDRPSIPKVDEIENPTPENKAAQLIQRNIAADIYTVTDISRSQPVYAKNLARAIFVDATLYEKFVHGFDGKKHAQRFSVVAVSPELTTGKVGSFTVTEPSLVMLVTNMDATVDGDPNVNPLLNDIVSRFSYGDGATHHAVTFRMQRDNPNFVDYPENLAPTR